MTTVSLTADFGASVDNKDNTPAWELARSHLAETGGTLVLEGDLCFTDADLIADWPNPKLIQQSGALRFDSCGLVFQPGAHKQRGGSFPLGLRMSREGDSGPAVAWRRGQADYDDAGNLTRKSAGSPIRWSGNDLNIEQSSGKGAELSTFLATIHGMWIAHCEGVCLDIAPEEGGTFGANSFTVFGGELINGEHGATLRDTKGVRLIGVCAEGNRGYGMHLIEDNRNFEWTGYNENNAKKARRNASFDLVLGVEPTTSSDGKTTHAKANYNVTASFYASDGAAASKHSVMVHDNQFDVGLVQCGWSAYDRKPVIFANGRHSNSTGYVLGSSSRRPANDDEMDYAFADGTVMSKNVLLDPPPGFVILDQPATRARLA